MRFGKCKVLGFALALLALPMMGAMDDASAQNILDNGYFETGDLTGWQVLGGNASATVTIDSPDNGDSWGGSHNAFMDNQGEAIGLTLKQTTPVGSASGGTTWYSVDLKLIQADVGGVLFVEIFAEQEGVGIIGGSGLMGPFWPWNVWQQFEGTFEAPAATDFLTIQIMANTGAAIGTNCRANVDNVFLSQEGPPVGTEARTLSDVKNLYR